MGDNGIKVIGKNLSPDGVAELTVAVPPAQLESWLDAVDGHLPVGKAQATRNLGERYGLKPESQVISVPDPTDREKRLRLARSIYDSEPIVANVIDLMVDFCLTGMENVCQDTKAKEFFDLMCKYGDFDELHRQIFLEDFLSGDIFILRGKQNKVTYGADTGAMYFDYTVLNPLQIEVDGPLVFSQELIGIKPNKELKDMLESNDPAIKKVVRNLPNDLKKAALEDKLYYPKPDEVSRISRKRQGYERYAAPYITRVFEPVLLKRRLRDADAALAETVRYVLVTITTGNDEFPAKGSDIEKLASLFENPSKSLELFWNHTINIEYHYPDASLFEDTKYNQVNKDILDGLGIPAVLIDGTGSFASAWTSLLSVMERLDSTRARVARWQEKEYRVINEKLRLNFKEIPSVRFKPLNLRDDKVFKNLLLELWDRGQLSTETLLSLADQDFSMEVRKRQAEKKAGIEEILTPRDQKAFNDPGGRPNDKVDPGDYSDRDQPDLDSNPPESEPSTEN